MDNIYTFTIHWDGSMKTVEKLVQNGLLTASNGKYRYGNLINTAAVECKGNCLTFTKYKVCYCREVTMQAYKTAESESYNATS